MKLKHTPKIKTLKTELERYKERARHVGIEINEVIKRLNSEYAKQFAKDKDIKQAIKELNNTREYTTTEYGDIAGWVRFDNIPEDEVERAALEQYFSDEGYTLDTANSALMRYEGESIVINDEGDVFLCDSGHSKLIISKKEYRDDASWVLDTHKRNLLIEAWMESNGYFPGVFRQDYHGNIYPVSTKEKE